MCGITSKFHVSRSFPSWLNWQLFSSPICLTDWVIFSGIILEFWSICIYCLVWIDCIRILWFLCFGDDAFIEISITFFYIFGCIFIWYVVLDKNITKSVGCYSLSFPHVLFFFFFFLLFLPQSYIFCKNWTIYFYLL